MLPSRTMTESSGIDGAVSTAASSIEHHDPVLRALEEAEHHYRATLEVLTEAQRENGQLRAEQALARAELERLQKISEHERERSNALSESLQHIHRALFGGGTYELILKACLSLTNATRGAYLTASPIGEMPQPKAVFELDLDHNSPLQEFVSELAREVISTEQVSVQNDLANALLLPPEVRGLSNCIAAPVVLRSALHGVVFVADKSTRGFDDQDAAALISVGGHAAVAIENLRLQREVHDVYLSLVTVLADTMAARDPHLRDAMGNASHTASSVAQRLGLSEYQQSLVYYAMQLRDVGNIGISDGVLNKPGDLLDAERELIHAHVEIGHDLLGRVPLLEDVAGIVRHHHERVDGSGYPDGLIGDAIPLEARIIAVVDAYTAMLSPRSYRGARSPEEACGELQRGVGAQFDARVVDAFLADLTALTVGAGTRFGTSAPHLPTITARERERGGLAAE